MGKGIKGLLILHFLNDGVRTTFVTLLPFIAKDLSLNLSAVGFLGSAQPLFASLLALPAGFFASKFGGFHFLIFLLIIYSIAAFGTAISPNLIFIILAFSLAALGFGMFHTVSFSLVAKVSKTGKIGQDMANFTSIGDIGRFLIPPLAVFLVSAFSWRIAMATIALTGLSAFLMLKLLQPKKEEYNLEDKDFQKESSKEFLKHTLNLLKTKKLLLTIFAAIADSLASSPIFIFLPFLLFAKGIHVTEYGIATGVFFAGSFLGKSALGRAVDKFGNLKVFIISEICMAATLIILTLVPNFLLILFLSLLLGLFTRGTTPVIQAMFSEVSHKMHYNKIFALSEMFIGIAAVITVILMGMIADHAGIVIVFYAAAFLALLATIPAFILSKNTESSPISPAAL